MKRGVTEAGSLTRPRSRPPALAPTGTGTALVDQVEKETGQPVAFDFTSTTDVEVRKQAYNKVQERLTADLPYIWLGHTRWTLGASNSLRGVQGQTLPDGSQGAGLVGGVISVTSMWIDPTES